MGGSCGGRKRDFSAAWADTFAGAKVGKKRRATPVLPAAGEMTGVSIRGRWRIGCTDGSMWITVHDSGQYASSSAPFGPYFTGWIG